MPSGTLTVSYVVKNGHPRSARSTLSFNDVQSFGESDFEGEVSGAVTGGSFSDDGSFLELLSTESSPCAAKWVAGAGSDFQEG